MPLITACAWGFPRGAEAGPAQGRPCFPALQFVTAVALEARLVVLGAGRGRATLPGDPVSALCPVISLLFIFLYVYNVLIRF